MEAKQDEDWSRTNKTRAEHTFIDIKIFYSRSEIYYKKKRIGSTHEQRFTNEKEIVRRCLLLRNIASYIESLALESSASYLCQLKK